MYTTMVEAFTEIQKTFEKVTSHLTVADRAVKSADLNEIIDSAYACREMLALLKDLQTQVHKKQQLLEKVGCLIAAKVAQGGSVTTEYCTATPDVKTFASVPKPGEEGYRELMLFLGIQEDSSAFGVVRPHFKDLSEYLSRMQELGEDLPPGLTKTYTEWRLNLRKRKEVDGLEQHGVSDDEFTAFS